MRKHILFLAAVTFASTGAVFAHEYKIGSIAIGHPWARPTAEGAKAGAAYLTLENTAGEPDRLIGASTPVAEDAMIHETTDEGGVMQMHHVEGGVALPPGQNVAFKPGGYHIMLLGLKHKLSEGEHIPLTLTFAKAGSIDVELYVQKTPGESQGAEVMHDHGAPAAEHSSH